LAPNLGVKTLLSSICSNQGQKIGSSDAQRPESDFDRALAMAVDKIVDMVKETRSKIEVVANT